MSLPTPTIYHTLTSQPKNAASYTFNNLPANNSNPSFDANNGLNLDSNLNPQAGFGRGTQRQLIMPINSSDFNAGITVSFRVKLLFTPRNPNALRIFTHGSNFPPGVKPGQAYNSNESIIIQHGNFGAATSKVWLALSVTNSITGQRATTLQTPNIFSANTWYLITYTINSSGLVTFYVNGDKITDNNAGKVSGAGSSPCSNAGKMCTTVSLNNINIRTSSSNPAILPQYLRLGDRYTGKGFGMSGHVRDFLVFNTALSKNEIDSLYNIIISPNASTFFAEKIDIAPPCDNWKVYMQDEVCSCDNENPVNIDDPDNPKWCEVGKNSKNYKLKDFIGAAGYLPYSHPDQWVLADSNTISPFTSIITNNIETFVNINLDSNIVSYTKLYSIVGILFYATVSIANLNYNTIIPNKNVSFVLNVLLVICILISISANKK